jgi:hypothetical protein
VKETNQGKAPARRIAILCMSVAVVALLLAASAVSVLAATKKSSDTTSGRTTNGGTASPDTTNKSSDKHSGDKLTNEVKSPSPQNKVQITLTEDGTNATSGVAAGVIDILPSGFKIKSITSSYYSCTGESTNEAQCYNISETNTKKTIKIVAKAPKSGKYTNQAVDNYNNYTWTPFKVK